MPTQTVDDNLQRVTIDFSDLLDGVKHIFPIRIEPLLNSEKVELNGLPQSTGYDWDYVIVNTNGLFSLYYNQTPYAGDRLVISYTIKR
jgi:hypothetical protein